MLVDEQFGEREKALLGARPFVLAGVVEPPLEGE